MHPILVRRSLEALANPVAIVAALLLGFNAVVAQPLWPTALTGKAGDVAWLIVAPMLAALALGLVAPRRWDARRLGYVAIALTGLVFALIKTWPPTNALAVTLIRPFGITPKLTLDPSDLLALPALGATLLIWRHAEPGAAQGRRLRLASGALLATLAVVADSPGPLNLGANCVVERDGVISAYSQVEQHSYFQNNALYWQDVYTSSDGGATWTTGTVSQEERTQTLACEQAIWPLDLGANVSLYFVAGQGMYASDDGGQTLRLEQKLDTILSALYDERDGTVIVAAGAEGLYVRGQSGSWTQVPGSGR